MEPYYHYNKNNSIKKSTSSDQLFQIMSTNVLTRHAICFGKDCWVATLSLVYLSVLEFILSILKSIRNNQINDQRSMCYGWLDR